MPDLPILIVSPQDDAAFRRLAEEALAAGADTPRALQAAVRERYPNALVRARELTAEPGVMWYVYRRATGSRVDGMRKGRIAMADVEDDLRATGETIAADAQRLATWSARKRPSRSTTRGWPTCPPKSSDSPSGSCR